MKAFLRIFILSSILYFSIFNITFAQESIKKSTDSVLSKEEVKNFLKSGMWSIQFGIGSNFTLTNFDDAVLAIKFQFSRKSALRLDFNLDYFRNQENEFDYTLRQEENYAGNLSYLYYINPKADFNIYISLGVNYSYSYYYYSNDGGDYNEVSSWLIGPKAGAGAEYFVFRSMSLFAEYNYILGVGKEKYTHGFYNISESRESDITSLLKKDVKFGLSVYF